MLDRFLGRGSVYQSDWGVQFEFDARANLERLRAQNRAHRELP